MKKFNLHSEMIKQGCAYAETTEDNGTYNHNGNMLIILNNKTFLHRLPGIEQSLIFSAPISTETVSELLELLEYINRELYVYQNMFADYQLNCEDYNE